MTDARKQIIQDARRWVEQEQVWGEQLYASSATKKRSEMILSTNDEKIASPAAASRDDGQKVTALASLYEQYKDCTRCPLGSTRIKFVFGVGSPTAQVMFIGEGPGYYEDRKGEPFVGRAGQLLDKIMASIGLNRQNAYIANIVKCHPMINPQTPEAHSNDRAPVPEEVEACSPILLQQIAIIQPRVIVTLGSPSTRMILRTKEGITQLRGKLFPFAVDAFYPDGPAQEGDFFMEAKGAAARPEPFKTDPPTREALRRIQVLPTFHPAAVLRNPNLKADVWTDMKLLRGLLAGKGAV